MNHTRSAKIPAIGVLIAGTSSHNGRGTISHSGRGAARCASYDQPFKQTQSTQAEEPTSGQAEFPAVGALLAAPSYEQPLTKRNEHERKKLPNKASMLQHL
jgi:hypothetical protein